MTCECRHQLAKYPTQCLLVFTPFDHWLGGGGAGLGSGHKLLKQFLTSTAQRKGKSKMKRKTHEEGLKLPLA